MSSYVSNLVHFVWGTKERRPLIKDDWKDRLYGYMVFRMKIGICGFNRCSDVPVLRT